MIRLLTKSTEWHCRYQTAVLFSWSQLGDLVPESTRYRYSTADDILIQHQAAVRRLKLQTQI